jgi:hypothetical protein
LRLIESAQVDQRRPSASCSGALPALPVCEPFQATIDATQTIA